MNAWAPHSAKRVEHEIAVFPGHETLNEEVQNDEGAHALLREALHDHSLPDAYYQHPVVQDEGTHSMFPLGLYLDGTPYTKKDSLLCLVLVNIVTGTRHLMAVIRKQQLCRCGFRGW